MADDLTSLLVDQPDSASAAPATSNLPAPMRNNNPGAMMPGGKLAQYPTMEAGLQALDANLKSYGTKGINTLKDTISRWAPPNENNTAAYLADAVKVTGLDPNAPIDLSNPLTRHLVSAAIIKHENGASGISSLQNSRTQSAQQQPVAGQPAAVDPLTALLVGDPQQPPQARPVQQPPSQISKPASAPSHGPIVEGLINAGAGALGVTKGIWDTLVDGPAQLAANTAADLYPKSWPGSDYLQQIANQGVQARSDAFNQATQGHEQAVSIGSLAGSVAGGLALPIGKAGEATNFVGRLLQATKTGIGQGLAQPVENSGSNFYGQKAEQGIGGAVAGLVGQPVAELGGKVLGSAVNSVGTAAKNVWHTLSGGDSDLAQALANSSPELQQAVKQEVNNGGTLNNTALARQIRADGLPVKINLTPGQATQDPVTISQEMNGRGKDPARSYAYNDQNNRLLQNLDSVRQTGAPDVNVPDLHTAGSTLIQSGQNVLGAAKANISQLYQKLADANGGNMPMDGLQFATATNDALNAQMRGAFLPRELQSILNEFQSGNRQMTFENFENLRTILGQEQRKMEEKGGAALGAVNIMRNQLENMPIPDALAGIKPLADDARNAVSAYNDLLKQSPALNAIDSGKAFSDDFVQRHVIGAHPEQLVTLASTLQNDPTALQTLKAGTVNWLRTKAAGETGNFSQSNYNTAINALGPKLDIMFTPEEASTLRNIGHVAKDIQVQPKGSFVNNSNTAVEQQAEMARKAGNVAAGLVDSATGLPIGSMANNAMQTSAAQKATAKQTAETLRTGAGAVTPSKMGDLLKHQVPVAAGQYAPVPLASLLSRSVNNRQSSNAP